MGKTSSMVRVRKSGPTMLAMKVPIERARSTEEASSCGPTVQPIPANSSRTTSMETEPIPGPMVVCTMASGKTTKWTAQASSHGLMDVSTRVNTSTTRRRVMVCLPGLMVANTTATGAMASSTDSESTTRPAKKSKRESGMKESVSAGLSREMSQKSEDHLKHLNALLENDKLKLYKRKK